MRPATKLFFLILTATAAIIIYLNLYTTTPLPNSPAFFKINRLTGSTQLCVPSVDGLRCRSSAEIRAARAAQETLARCATLDNNDSTTLLPPECTTEEALAARCATLDDDFARLVPYCKH